MLARLSSGTSGRPYTTLAGGRGGNAFSRGAISASENALLKRFCCRWIFPAWCLEGRDTRDHRRSSNAWELLGHTWRLLWRTLWAPALVENFTQAAWQQWWRLASIGKVLSIHNPLLCFPHLVGSPGTLSSPSPAEKVVHPS